MSTECTDVPGPTALSKGWTCEDSLENNGEETMLELCQGSGWTTTDTCGLTCTKIGARDYDYCLNSLLTQWVYGTQFDQSPYSVTMDVHPDVMYSSLSNCTYVSNKAYLGPPGRKIIDHTQLIDLTVDHFFVFNKPCVFLTEEHFLNF